MVQSSRSLGQDAGCFDTRRSSFWFLKPREQFRGFLCVRGPPFHPNRAPVCGVDQLVTTCPATALWQVPARRSAWRRVGALTLDMRVVSAQKKGPGLLKDGAL